MSRSLRARHDTRAEGVGASPYMSKPIGKLRYLVRTNDEDRRLCWFELKDNDLYWGSAKPDSLNIEPIEFSGGSVSLTLPSVLEVLKGQSFKGSYHASGYAHSKLGKAYHGVPYRLPVKAVIQKPLMFAALLTMPANLYPPYGKKLTGNLSHAMVNLLPAAHIEHRLLLECFLTPAGTFGAPPPLFRFKSDTPPPMPQTQSLGPDLILAIRPYVIGGDLSKWQPAVEVWFSFTHPPQ
jgi:hypothetical protein